MKEIIEKRKNKVLTGFVDLDNMIDGLHNSELIIIGARPGMGKTAFALNIVKKVTNVQKISTVFFSMELSQEQILNQLNNMKMEDNDNLIIDDTPGITIDEIALKIGATSEGSYDTAPINEDLDETRPAMTISAADPAAIYAGESVTYTVSVSDNVAVDTFEITETDVFVICNGRFSCAASRKK